LKIPLVFEIALISMCLLMSPVEQMCLSIAHNKTGLSLKINIVILYLTCFCSSVFWEKTMGLSECERRSMKFVKLTAQNTSVYFMF